MEPAASVNTIRNVQMTFSKLYFYWGRLAEWQLSLNHMDHSCTMESAGTHIHTHRDRERRNNWHFNTTLQTDTCIDKHKDCPTEGKKASLHTSFAFEDCVIWSAFLPWPFFLVMVQGTWLSQSGCVWIHVHVGCPHPVSMMDGVHTQPWLYIL